MKFITILAAIVLLLSCIIFFLCVIYLICSFIYDSYKDIFGKYEIPEEYRKWLEDYCDFRTSQLERKIERLEKKISDDTGS